MLALFAFLPRIDPLGGNVAAFREQYDTFVVLPLAFLTYVHGLVLAAPVFAVALYGTLYSYVAYRKVGA